MAQAAAMTQTGLEDPAWIRLHEILTMCSVPMALRAAIQLNVMEILASENAELSSQTIVSYMKAKYKQPISNPAAHIALDRILRVLASQGLLSSSLAQHEGGDGGLQQRPVRKYGLNPVSRYLASGPKGAPSLAAFPVMGLQKANTDAWLYMEQAVREGGEPFQLANGKNAFLFGKEHPEFGEIFNAAMSNQSLLFNEFLLQSYDGFRDLSSLVDVGGGMGACLRAIVTKYPQIKGINFDEPHVISSAYSHPGIENVGGDMFASVPQADAIYMKWILHDWSDELCVKLLKNCYKALPPKGKVIVVDVLLSSTVEMTPQARIAYALDLFMFTYFQGGRERTLEELQELSTLAGFGPPQVITHINELSVIELIKN